MSLMIVVILAFLVPVLLHRLRLKFIPVVVAEIIAGLVIGKTGFNVIEEDPWLKLLSLFGFIFLMFLSGLEIDFSAFTGGSASGARTNKGPRPLTLALVMFAGIVAVSFVLAFGLTWGGFVREPVLMALIISTISLGVVVPVLKEKKLLDTGIGQTMLLTTVLLDFATMLGLAVYVSLQANNVMQIWLLLAFFVLVFVIYRIIRRSVRHWLLEAIGTGTAQLGTRSVFALILLFVVMSESFGVENILGAFLAGLIVSVLSPSKPFVHQLESFGYGFLIPIFFVMVGARMDLRTLLTEPQVWVLIPLLLAAFFAAKMIPALFLKRWYGWRDVFSAGTLLTAKLSLVIAASAIALDLGLIEERTNGALILVSVLTCLSAPVVFSKLMPKADNPKVRVSIIGANRVTLPLAHDLHRDGYAVSVFTANLRGVQEEEQPLTEEERMSLLVSVEGLDEANLERAEAFAADLLMLGTQDDEANLRLARHGRQAGVSRIIVRLEQADKVTEARREAEEQGDGGWTVFSTQHAARTLLKALVEQPSAVKLLAEDDGTIREVVLNNPKYDDVLLRMLPLKGDTLILRIYRGRSFIIPHGNTQVKIGDRLLLSGGAEPIAALRAELE